MLMKSEMNNRLLIFVFEKTKIANQPKISVTGREGKTGSGANESKMALVQSPRDDTCLRRAVSSGNVTPTAIRSLPVPWPRSLQRNGLNVFFHGKYAFVLTLNIQGNATQGREFQFCNAVSFLNTYPLGSNCRIPGPLSERFKERGINTIVSCVIQRDASKWPGSAIQRLNNRAWQLNVYISTRELLPAETEV